jgi:hypothetical protein
VLEFDFDEVESGFVARFLDACGVPEPDLAETVERARELATSAGVGLLEITISSDAGRARVLPAAGREAPSAAV